MCKIYIKSNKRGFFDLTKENSMNEQSYIQRIGLINFYFRYRKKISLPNSYGMCSLCIFCIQSINLFGKMNLIGNLYEKKQLNNRMKLAMRQRRQFC